MLLALQGKEVSNENNRTFGNSLWPQKQTLSIKRSDIKYHKNLILSIKIRTCGSFSCLFTKAFTSTPLWTDAERCSTFYRNKEKTKQNKTKGKCTPLRNNTPASTWLYIQMFNDAPLNTRICRHTHVKNKPKTVYNLFPLLWVQMTFEGK